MTLFTHAFWMYVDNTDHLVYMDNMSNLVPQIIFSTMNRTSIQ